MGQAEGSGVPEDCPQESICPFESSGKARKKHFAETITHQFAALRAQEPIRLPHFRGHFIGQNGLWLITPGLSSVMPQSSFFRFPRKLPTRLGLRKCSDSSKAWRVNTFTWVFNAIMGSGVATGETAVKVRGSLHLPPLSLRLASPTFMMRTLKCKPRAPTGRSWRRGK